LRRLLGRDQPHVTAARALRPPGSASDRRYDV
jgi:hypothetical protein